MVKAAEPNELRDILDTIADIADEALDPEMTREDVVRRLKDIADLASSEDYEPELNTKAA